jgi:hypothetical protein
MSNAPVELSSAGKCIILLHSIYYDDKSWGHKTAQPTSWFWSGMLKSQLYKSSRLSDTQPSSHVFQHALYFNNAE